MSIDVHISSLIVHVRPEYLDAVRQSILDLGGEVPGIDPSGKIVTVIETESETGISEFTDGVANLDGVLAANLVFHLIDDEAEERVTTDPVTASEDAGENP